MSTISSSNSSGRSVYSMLQGSTTDSADLFSTLAGTNGGGSNSALFGALAGGDGSATSVDNILQQKKVDLAKNSIYNNAAQRLAGIQAGTHTPSDEWEKVAGYAMAKGKPVVVSLDKSGQVQAQLQSESSLAKFNPQIQQQILQLDADTELMAQKITANATNDGWLAKLKGASNDLYQVYNSYVSAQTSTKNNWEQTGVLELQMHKPFKIKLDANGDLTVQDQASDPDLTKLPYGLQKKLSDAIASVPDLIRNGTGTTKQSTDGAGNVTGTFTYFEEWQTQAQSFANSGIPFYLDIDASTGTISAKENSAENITPDFLKKAPYPDVGDNSPALKQAAEFIKAGKAYFFDVDSTGAIGAKEATVQNITTYNKTKTSPTTTQGAGSILSLFA